MKIGGAGSNIDRNPYRNFFNGYHKKLGRNYITAKVYKYK